MDKITVAQARQVEAVGRQVCLQGWVRTRRDSKGGFSFLEINDGSCFGNVQVLAEQALPNYASEILHLTAGCSVRIMGLVKASPGKGQATEVEARSVTVHGWSDPETFPIQKKGASFEFLRTVATKIDEDTYQSQRSTKSVWVPACTYLPTEQWMSGEILTFHREK